MEDYGTSFEVSFDGDAMTLFVTGAIIILATTNSIIRTVMKMQNNRLTTIIYLTLSVANLIYSIARAIRLSIKNIDITVYWIWMAVAVLLIGYFVGLYIYLKKILHKEEPQVTA